MLLFFDDYEEQSRKLAAVLDLPCHIIHRHRFPDGENKLTLPARLPEHVLICRSLDQPNEKLLELLLAAKAARELGDTLFVGLHSDGSARRIKGPGRPLMPPAPVVSVSVSVARSSRQAAAGPSRSTKRPSSAKSR